MLKIYFLFHIRYTVDERTGRPMFFIKITWWLVFAWGFKTTTIKLLFSRELFYIYILGCTLITFKHIFSTVLLINPGKLSIHSTVHVTSTSIIQVKILLLLHIYQKWAETHEILSYLTTTFSVIMWGSLKVFFESVCMGFYSKFYELL